MARGKEGSERNHKRRVRSKDSSSDDSDEDYVVEEEEEVSNDEDFVESVDVFDSEECAEEEEEFDVDDGDEPGFRKVSKSRKTKASVSNGKNRGKPLRKRKRVSYEENEEEDCEGLVKSRKVSKSKKTKDSVWNEKDGSKPSRNRKRVSYEEEEGEDYVNDDDDEEFTPEEEEELEEENEDEDYDGEEEEEEKEDEDYEGEEEEEEKEDEDYEGEEEEEYDDVDSLDEDEELMIKKKNNHVRVHTKRARESSSLKGRKGRRKPRNSGKHLVKKGRVKRHLRKKVTGEYDEEDDCDLIMDNVMDTKVKNKKNPRVKRSHLVVDSDSDILSSVSPDCEYTQSEEHKDQVREAKTRELKASIKSSESLNNLEEDGKLSQWKKPLGLKGKEKVEVESEVVKRVCGVCLSDEDKRRLQGILDCCSHYFCFTCIMEWSKVESRCPLCKQRFSTITKVGRSTIGDMVITIPERDQVYQPSEEEIRSFIDPYENVICTECHEGGDDGLMLLCDLCDSPAHTYCVGLGHEVPEGNWYCEGCKPVAVGSSSSQADQAQNPSTPASNLAHRPSPVVNGGEELNPTWQSSPHVASTHGFVNPSPRPIFGDGEAVSPLPGIGTSTLSGRREIQRRIQNIRWLNRMSSMAHRADISGFNFCNNALSSQISSEMPVQNLQRLEMGTTQQTLIGRLQGHNLPSTSVQNMQLLTVRSTQLRSQVDRDPTVITPNRPANLTLWPELTAVNPVSNIGNMAQSSCGSIAGCGDSFLTRKTWEQNQFYAVKDQLHSVVISHLKSLSQYSGLGYDNFELIAASSTHTILAACGLEHNRAQVQLVPQPEICRHGDRLIAGQTSMMKGFCSACFDSFVRDVVRKVMDTRLPSWLSLGL